MQRDVEMARVVHEERIPDDVKIKMSLSASKYFESGAGNTALPNPAASAKSKSRRLDPAAPRPASAKSQSRKLTKQGSDRMAPAGTGSLKLQRTASASTAAAASSNVLPATSTHTKREGSSSATQPTPLVAGGSAPVPAKKPRRTPEEKAAKKARKKERKDRKAAGSGGLPTGINVIDAPESSDSDADDGFTAVKL